ncbi:MAG: hypothetical protein PHE50_00755 [Dehalococcoidales bacterium]|nr:hypothetical protein [Dehalococcoidales bacterium]
MRSIYALCLKIRRNQQGQALPLAMAALILGGLVIAPILTQTSGALTGSRVYQTIIKDTYTADAGVEHAIWRLTNDGLAAALPLAGNSTTYTLPNQVNGLAPTITVTNTKAGGGGTTGTITQAIIDSLEFDPGQGDTPMLLNVSGSIYAVVYSGPGNNGWLKTFTIATNGDIATTVIDTYEFESNNGVSTEIIHISGTVYAIAYMGPGSDGWLATINIAANGIITHSLVSSFEFDTGNGREPHIINISGTVYAITYRGVTNHGFLRTVNIAANGAITQSVISSYEFDTAACYKPDIIRISGNVYGIAYTGNADDGYLKTVTVDANGLITQSTIDTWDFDVNSGFDCAITPISGSVYLITYRSASNVGKFFTLSIVASGTITKSPINAFYFDNNRGYEPSVLPLGGDVYAIAYRDASSHGYLKTFQIQANGQINSTAISTLTFDSTRGYEPCIISVSSGVFAIAYRGPNDNGWVKTVGITQSGGGSGAAMFSVQSNATNISITAAVNVNGATATVSSWVVQKR